MVVMSIAGVDPSAGAGIFADLKVFQALNVYGTGVVTALTAQNPYHFFSIEPVNSDYIESQIDSILDSYSVEYVKTGMLYSKENMKAVGKKIQEYDFKTVVDPIMIATSGGILSKDDSTKYLKKYVLKNAIFTTPNTYEAEKLTGLKISNKDSAIEASLKLGDLCNNIITGGHLNGINVINIDGEITIKKQELIESNNLHGSGCNFSAGIVSFLERKNTLKESVLKSLNYTFESVRNGNYGTLIAKNE